MGVLDKKMSGHNKAVEKKIGKVPQYSGDGKQHSKLRFIPITLGFIVIIVGLFVAAVQIPALKYKEQPQPNDFTVVAENGETITVSRVSSIKPNESGVKNMLDYGKDHPNDDFDMDGLTNAEESVLGSDMRNPDTDNDGISDYAEAHIYNTRPTQSDNKLLSIVKDRLEKNGVNISTPYKIHDVVMWADNLGSRARGTVIPTIRGYRFCNFTGYAQFPENAYAYKIVNGYHVPLDYRPEENAWRIDDDLEVILYEQPLETAYLLTAFGEQYYVEEGTLTKVLSLLLPKEHSFMTIRKVVLQDNWNVEVSATVTGKVMPKIDKNDMSRFGNSTTQFSDVTDVYTSIMSGKPVAVSLQSPSRGEFIGVVYGYTDYGDMLVANEKGEHVGVLDIIECSSVMVDQNNEMRLREYVEAEGLGFDTRLGDKIHFIFEK